MIVVWMSLALAGFTLESQPVSARTDALVTQEQAQVLGHTARVVRRYRQGEGWEFVVQVTVDDRPAAEAAAAALEAATGASISITEASGEASTAHAPPVASAPELPEVDAVFERVRRAHGLGEGASRLSDAGAVRFRYQRMVSTPEGELQVRSTWARDADAVLLVIDVLDGPGSSSALVVGTDGRAWVATSTEVAERPAAASRALMDRHGPAELMALGVAMPALLAEAETASSRWRVVHDDGGSSFVLEELGAGGGATTRLRVDLETWRVSGLEVVDETGRSSWILSDWREISASLVLPFELERRIEGDIVERLRVLELSLDPVLEAGLFGVPDRRAAVP